MSNDAPNGRLTASSSISARLGAHAVRSFVRPILSPRNSFRWQRRLIECLCHTLPRPSDVLAEAVYLNGVETEKLSCSPGQSRPHCALLYLHGGGFAVGSARAYRAVTMALAANTGLDVFVPNYRLAPEHPYPAALDDVLAVLNALCAKSYALSDIVIAGDSAGATLAMAAIHKLLGQACARPRALALICPLADVSGQHLAVGADDALLTKPWLHMTRDAYVAKTLWQEPLVSPIFGNFERFPPTYLQSASADLLARDAHRLHAALTQAQVPLTVDRVPGLWHDFQLYAGVVSEARTAVSRLSTFITRQAALA